VTTVVSFRSGGWSHFIFIVISSPHERQEDEGKKSQQTNKSSRNTSIVEQGNIEWGYESDKHEDREDEGQREGLPNHSEDAKETENNH
jgi:hypothetical protein